MTTIYDNKQFFEAYATMSRSKEGLKGAGEWHQLQPLFPNLKDKIVLDLGCGYGWHCKYANDCGASSVLGIDGSSKMIEKAKEINFNETIEYRVCNLEEFEYIENSYDFVISNLVLHYIEDLESIYKNVYKTLKKDGYFLFNIEHPSFTAGINQDWVYKEDGTPLHWPMDNYYYPGKRETLFLGQKVEKYHHTLSQIINPLLQIGFQIEAIEEAMPSKVMLDIPGMIDEMRRPMMLLIKVKKC